MGDEGNAIARNTVYGRIGDAASLAPVERDPRTGKPLAANRARRNKQPRAVPAGRARRRPLARNPAPVRAERVARRERRCRAASRMPR
jgi:hypothetical protein